MKSKAKHKGGKNNKRLQMRCTSYEPDFKKAVVMYAEQKSTREAKRRYGISESNIRRWRRLKSDLIEKTTKPKTIRRSPRVASSFENTLDESDSIDFSSSLDSMPLEKRLKVTPEQEPVLQSQPLSPTKLKVTRQSTKPVLPSPKPVTPDPPNEEICLRWNSHHTNMQSSFPNLLMKEQYVDATLVAEGQSLKCHRLILSSCSPYFEEVLNGISPYQHPVLFMKDIPFWVLKSLCDFMYAGEVHIFQNKLEELLSVAESLKIKGLAGKTDSANEEAKNPEPTKPVREEKKDEKEVKEKKRNSQHIPELPPRPTSKSIKSVYIPRKSERVNKEALSKGSILDPLDLLEPVYEEVTKETAPPRIRESKNIPVKKGKLKKRKLSEGREESPPPMFLSRKGTRSRPNVKIPKYYHTHYERLPEPATIVREPHTQSDPLLSVDEIKSEPLDLDDVIEIEDNLIGFTDVPEMVVPEEEIIGNYDSPIVNPTKGIPEKVRRNVKTGRFKKINLVAQPIIMNVHSVEEKAPSAVQIIDVGEFKSTDTVLEKTSDPLATEGSKPAEDPLNFVIPLESDSITITNVQSMAEVDDLEERRDENIMEDNGVTKEQDELMPMETSVEPVDVENVTTEVEVQSGAANEQTGAVPMETSVGSELDLETLTSEVEAESGVANQQSVSMPMEASVQEVDIENVMKEVEAESGATYEQSVSMPMEASVQEVDIENITSGVEAESGGTNEQSVFMPIEASVEPEFDLGNGTSEVEAQAMDEPEVINEAVEAATITEIVPEVPNETQESVEVTYEERIVNNVEENAPDCGFEMEPVQCSADETPKVKGCVSNVDVPTNATSEVEESNQQTSEDGVVNDAYTSEVTETRDAVGEVLNEDAEFLAETLEKLLDK